MTLPSIYIFACLVHIRENIENNSVRSTVHDHSTRSCEDLCLKYCRTSKALNSWEIFGVKFFNLLPSNARNVSITHFKNVLLKWLLSKAFYSIDDFFEMVLNT